MAPIPIDNAQPMPMVLPLCSGSLMRFMRPLSLIVRPTGKSILGLDHHSGHAGAPTA